MNPATLLDEQFRAQFGVPLQEPEREVNQPEPKHEPSLTNAMKNLQAELKAWKTKSVFWDDMAGNVLNDLDGESLDQMMMAVQDGEAQVLLTLMQGVYDKALRETAEENLGEL